ncbi:MAG: hypothetical protein ACKVJU_00995 [Verrucomicrobiales bacterium]
MVATLVALGLWPLSYKILIGVKLPIKEHEVGFDSYNGSLNVWMAPEKPAFKWFYKDEITLAARNSTQAEELIENGMEFLAEQRFGTRSFEIVRFPTLSVWIQIPWWSVAIIFLLFGTLWQIFGNRPDDAVESD